EINGKTTKICKGLQPRNQQIQEKDYHDGKKESNAEKAKKEKSNTKEEAKINFLFFIFFYF
ncbi:hypothetical protein KY317_02900, partial [Candidatus Woesearchaeota archaeon]|nr:hypothetical protein [Candidatus Woesearchaeota archaeon]